VLKVVAGKRREAARMETAGLEANTQKRRRRRRRKWKSKSLS